MITCKQIKKNASIDTLAAFAKFSKKLNIYTTKSKIQKIYQSV